MKRRHIAVRNFFVTIAIIVSAFIFNFAALFSYRLIESGAGLKLAFVPMLLFFVFMVIVIIIFMHQADKGAKEADSYYEMIEGLTGEWDTIIHMDIDKDTGRLLKMPAPIAIRFRKEIQKGAANFLHFYATGLVTEDYREYVKPQFEKSGMISRLSIAPSFSVLYCIRHLDGSRHHYEAQIIRIGDFEREHKILFATKNVDGKEQKEADVRQHLEDSVTTRTKELQEKNERLSRLNEDIIGFLGNIVEARDTESGEHVRRVKGFTHILAEQVMKDYPEYGLTMEKVDLIASASALHDLGKIAIPDAILLKPGKLTSEEFETMKEHSTRGCEILKLAPMDWSEEYLHTSIDICKYHHEKYDGSGYPDGLVGDEIPISAQIVSVVDCFDALINKRCYKEAYPFDVAYSMILGGECGVFSPKILECFKKCKERFIEHAKNKESTFEIKAHVKTSDYSLEGIKILVVEDDRVSRDITKSILEENGAVVTEAGSGEEAVKLFKESEGRLYDAILMDIFMPGMDGFDSAVAIRNSKVRGAETVPIIAISASHSEMDVNRATEMGMNAYLFKPISAGKISKALVNCMRDQANELQRKLTKTNRVANRDSLTGVRSMAAYMDKVEALKEYVNKALDASFGLVECDLNGLKGVNDTYGHDIGDVYIVNSCHAICDVFKHSPVYRIGGDEFVVVLEGEDFANREALMEQLRAVVEESSNKTDPVHGRFSIASGLAVFDASIDKTVGDVLKRADVAMYNNKKVMHMTVSN